PPPIDFRRFDVLQMPILASFWVYLFSFFGQAHEHEEMNILTLMYWDPDPVLFTIPYFNFPILWYGFFFALGFWLSALLFSKLLRETFQKLSPSEDIPFRVRTAIDRLSLYCIVATLLGARLGHLLFYEKPSLYLSDPLLFFRFREGGLASHGAVFALILALILFSKRHREQVLTPFRLLDLFSVVAPLAASCIRIGNFINQEILGTPTNLPWAVTFGHPADGGLPLPRHPVQLYEALGYLGLFFLLFFLYKKPAFQEKEGRLAGLLLLLLFSLRFALEYCKQEQSALSSPLPCTIGALLSLPFIALGLYLFLTGKKNSLIPQGYGRSAKHRRVNPSN
ncbi:MAG: prolipoprotein diacylglyceryl transferase, partial [Verrucomicrobiota bacterium]|nr:prolipoprotein diacylglyceryl transferase [Verrucomicrobiota bacterium]